MRPPWMAWPIRPEFQPPAVTDGLDGLDGLLGRPIRQCSKRHTLYMSSKWALNFNEAPENTRWFLATRSCNSPPRALRLIGHGGRPQVSGFSVGSPTQLAFYANQQTRLAHTVLRRVIAVVLYHLNAQSYGTRTVNQPDSASLSTLERIRQRTISKKISTTRTSKVSEATDNLKDLNVRSIWTTLTLYGQSSTMAQVLGISFSASTPPHP